MAKSRKPQRIEFMLQHLDFCRQVFGNFENWKGYRDGPGRQLVDMLREAIPYSPKTASCDIFTSNLCLFRDLEQDNYFSTHKPKTMEKKFFYICPSLFVITENFIDEKTINATLQVKAPDSSFCVSVAGVIQFLEQSAQLSMGRTLEKTEVRLYVKGASAGKDAVDFPNWMKVNDVILKNYQGIVDVIGNAFLTGLLE